MKIDMIVGATLLCSQATVLPILVEAGLEALDRDRMVEAVVDVVLARPDHLDRGAAHFLRDERRLDREIGLRLAPEAAAEQRHIDRDLLGREAERLRHQIVRGLRALHARPDLAPCRRLCAPVAEGGSIVAWARWGM